MKLKSWWGGGKLRSIGNSLDKGVHFFAFQTSGQSLLTVTAIARYARRTLRSHCSRPIRGLGRTREGCDWLVGPQVESSSGAGGGSIHGRKPRGNPGNQVVGEQARIGRPILLPFLCLILSLSLSSVCLFVCMLIGHSTGLEDRLSV